MDFCQSETFRMEAIKEGVSLSSIINSFFNLRKIFQSNNNTFSCKQLKIVDRTLVGKIIFLGLFLQLDF